MAENQQPPANTPPPLPDPFVIPQQLLDKWLALPLGHYVEARLTRNDIDQLFFALTRSFQAQQILHECLIKLSNGDTPSANVDLDRARRLAVEGDNNARKFFAALVSSVAK